MSEKWVDLELRRRLPWLLVFRTLVATVLLVLALLIEARHLPLEQLTNLVYVVVVGCYIVVLILALCLRAQTSAVVVAAAYLALAVMSAVMVVQATGVVRSGFSFLFVLAILDGAIVGARRVALIVASACALLYCAQLLMQAYDLFDLGGPEVLSWQLVASGVGHVLAFYLEALLAGYLAELLRRAREQASTALDDLKLAHELHAAVLESLPIGVVTFDHQRRVQTVNASAAKLLGLPARDLLGGPLPRPLQQAFEVQDRSLESTVELGDRIVALGHASMATSAGLLELLVLEDRTELGRMQARVQAQARLASLGEMAAAIAHEIRNPLAAISGSLELLALDDRDGESKTRLFAIFMREVERLNRLVDEFLLYARPSPVERARVDVASLARELVEVCRTDALWRGLTLRLTTTPERMPANVDGRQVRQVLWNLLRNAAEASPMGGTVDLTVKADARETVILEVRDDGPGIDPKIRQHLFEPFRTTKPEGSGLGLAIVHRIVESHGGSVDLGSAPGGGTLARVTLPPLLSLVR